MGVLTAAGMSGSESPAPEAEPQAEPQAESQAEPQSPVTPTADPMARTDFVPFSKIEKTPGSRRSRAEQAIEDKVAGLRDSLSKDREQDRELIRQQQEALARISGQLEAMQRMPAPVAPAREPPKPDEDPEEMYRKADEALTNNNYDEWRRLTRKATVLEATKTVESRVAERIAELKQQIPAPVNPMVQHLLVRHQNVAMSGPRGEQAVMLKDKELELYGVPQGPDRLRKAFELADQMLGNQMPMGKPQYSPNSAAVLAGVPTGRSAGEGEKQEPGYTLNAVQKEVAKAAGMTSEEYVRWLFPERWRK